MDERYDSSPCEVMHTISKHIPVACADLWKYSTSHSVITVLELPPSRLIDKLHQLYVIYYC